MVCASVRGIMCNGVIYGFLQGAWPFGLLEMVWSLVALQLSVKYIFCQTFGEGILSYYRRIGWVTNYFMYLKISGKHRVIRHIIIMIAGLLLCQDSSIAGPTVVLSNTQYIGNINKPIPKWFRKDAWRQVQTENAYKDTKYKIESSEEKKIPLSKR